MTTTTTTNFLGLPIEGDITRGGRDDKPQRPLEEFRPIVATALAQPGVTELGWTQYTPYFNDGEPCVFRSYGLRSLTVDGVEIEEPGFPPYREDAQAVLGKRPVSWVDVPGQRTREKVLGDYSGPNAERYDALEALHDAIGDGEFDRVLLALFGDHAEVRVVPGEAVHVEFYEHD